MSEDSLKIEFRSKRMGDESYRGELEKLYESYIPKDPSFESSIGYRGKKAIYYRAFFSADVADSSALNSFLGELENKEVTDILVTAWYDSVGEEVKFRRVDGRLLDLAAAKELADYRAQNDDNKAQIRVNYGKTSRENTILIRLHVKAKKKRRTLFDLFSSALSSNDTDEFEKGFVKLIKSDSHDIQWCRFKWKEDKSWNEPCSENLIPALTDVIEVDDYLLLAFDLDKLENASNFLLDDFIWFVFSELDGVRKFWIKYRPKNRAAQYTYYPGMGDASYFGDKEIENDNDWPPF